MKKVYEPGEAMYKACTVVTIGYAKPWALLGPHGKAAWAAGERMYNSMMVNVHPDEQTDDSSGLPASLMD